jgi:hypothetical protein
MRVFGLAFAGALALTGPMAAQAVPLGSSMAPAGTDQVPRVIQVWDGGSSGLHPAPHGWHPAPGQVRQWNRGWVRPHWGQNWNSGWVPHGGAEVPTYWVWGPSGGAFDYPFADWRGPTGGWGNP